MDTSEKSRFNVPYGPDRYRRLSEHFHACADLPLKERERYLRDAKIADSGLRDELSSLLRYHAPEAKALAPRPRRKTWHRKPLFLSGIGAAATSLVLAVRTCTVQRLEATLREDAVLGLRDVVDSRSSLLRSWAARQKELARSVLEAPDLLLHVAALAEAAESLRERPQEALRRCPSYRYVSERMSRVPPELGGRGFLIVSRTGVALCAEPETLVGHPPAPDGAACRQRMWLGDWVLDGVVVGGPIRDPGGRIQAIALFRFPPEREFRGLLR